MKRVNPSFGLRSPHPPLAPLFTLSARFCDFEYDSDPKLMLKTKLSRVELLDNTVLMSLNRRRLNVGYFINEPPNAC